MNEINSAQTKEQVLEITLKWVGKARLTASHQNKNLIAKELNHIEQELRGNSVVINDDLKFASTKLNIINDRVKRNELDPIEDDQYEYQNILFKLEEKINKKLSGM